MNREDRRAKRRDGNGKSEGNPACLSLNRERERVISARRKQNLFVG